MRKILYVLVVLWGTGFVLSSCEKSGNVDNGDIVGDWICVEQVITLENGKTITYADKEDWLDDDNYIIFQYGLRFTENGYFNSIESYLDNYDNMRLPYQLNGNVLYVMGLSCGEIKFIGKNKMVITSKKGDNNIDVSNVAFELDDYDVLVEKAVCTYQRQ